jgi:hypothetical protein
LNHCFSNGKPRLSQQANSTSQRLGHPIVEDLIAEQLFFVSVVLLAGASITFGICWSAVKHDILGAWAISSFILTLGAVLIGVGQYIVH